MTGQARRSWPEPAPTVAQPLPSVDPAFDFAALLELSVARVLPAFESAFFDGFAMLITSSAQDAMPRH